MRPLLTKVKSSQDYLSEFVYGGIDGLVTTFAVVAGASGANLSTSVIIILGMANLIADGLSMSIGSYLSSKAELENYQKHVSKEHWSIDNETDDEIADIRKIFETKGFSGDLLEQIVAKVTENREVWVDTMMKDELEMIPDKTSPRGKAIATFVSFNLIGLIPLVFYILAVNGILLGNTFVIASIATAIGFIFIGMLKSYVNKRSIVRGIMETLLLGGVASVVAYFVGDVLEKLV